MSDSHRLYRLTEMAEIVATALEKDADYATYLHRRFRELHRQRVLPVAQYEGHGPTASALFDSEAIFLAALIVHVSDEPWHFTVVGQSMFAAAIVAAEARFSPGERPAGAGKSGLRYAISGVEKGEPWSLALHAWRDDTRSERTVQMAASFRTNEASKRVDDAFALVGKHTLGRLYVPLDGIFRPIIEAIGAA